MNYKLSLLALVPIAFTLTSCFDDVNPIKESDPKRLQWVLKDHDGEFTYNCAQNWKEGDFSNDVAACKTEFERLATSFNKSGFSNDMIEPENFELEAVWTTYVANIDKARKREEERKKEPDLLEQHRNRMLNKTK